jgi:hypothetical protein
MTSVMETSKINCVGWTHGASHEQVQIVKFWTRRTHNFSFCITIQLLMFKSTSLSRSRSSSRPLLLGASGSKPSPRAVPMTLKERIWLQAKRASTPTQLSYQTTITFELGSEIPPWLPPSSDPPPHTQLSELELQQFRADELA